MVSRLVLLPSLSLYLIVTNLEEISLPNGPLSCTHFEICFSPFLLVLMNVSKMVAFPKSLAASSASQYGCKPKNPNVSRRRAFDQKLLIIEISNFSFACPTIV